MSFEQDIVNLSDMAIKMRQSGEECTDSQFENGEKLIQQKQLAETAKNLLMEIRAVRNKNIIAKLKEKIRELEQSPGSSSTLPEGL